MTPEEKQLIELKQSLSLTPRRELKAQIEMLQSDLKHLVQCAISHSDLDLGNRSAHLFWLRQLRGMQKRSHC